MSCIESRQNAKGIAETIKGNRLVQVDYQDDTGFFFCHDVETEQKYRVHRQNIKFIPMIPSRFKEQHFKNIAHIWAEALEYFPKSIVVKSEGLSHETLARKLREAREAKFRYGWKHAQIDEENWSRTARSISIEVTDLGVVLGSKEQKKHERELKEVAVSIAPEDTQKTAIDFKGSFEEIEHLCLLIDRRLLNPQPVFILHGVTDEQAASLEERYDAGLVKQEDGTWWIL